MPYEIEATSKTPAFIIYLIDVSASMWTNMGSKRVGRKPFSPTSSRRRLYL